MRVVAFDIGVRNLSVAVMVCDNDDWKSLVIEHWQTIDCLTENDCRVVNSKYVSTQRLSRMVQQSITNRPYLFQKPVDTIVIEQQPLQRHGVGSARNKIIAHVVQIVCDMYYRFGLNIDPPPIISQSAKSKLQVNVDPGTFAIDVKKPSKQMMDSGADSLTYSDRKKHGIQLCRRVLANINCTHPDTARCVEVFRSHPRKLDDFADCLLHGLFYMQMHAGSEPVIDPYYLDFVRSVFATLG